MAELGTVYVDVKGDFDGFGKQANTSFGSIGASAAKIFAAAFVGVQVFNFAKESVGQANELNESVNAVNVTFRDNAEAINALGAASAENVGLSQSEFNALAVSTAGFAEVVQSELGQAVPQTVDDMTTRIADFASVMNLDVNTAGEEFRSIMSGSSEVARKYGLDMSAATVEQFALQEGIASSASEMTEADKTAARYGLLMQATERWAGDFANTSDQLANSTRIAQAEFKNAQAELGQALLPVLAEVMGLVRDLLIPALQSLMPVFVLLADSVSQLVPPVIQLVQMLAPLIAKILPPLAKILGIIIELFVALAEPILILLDAILTPLIPIIEMLAEEFGDALMPAILAVNEIVQALIPLLDLLMPLIQVLAEIAGMAAEILGSLLAGAIETVADWIGTLIEWITPAIEFVTDFASSIRDNLAESLEGAVTWFRELPGKIMGFVSDAITWLVDTGKNIIQGLIDGIKSMADKVVKAIVNFVLDKIPNFVKDFFGIGSPSKMFMEFGAALTEGLAMGIRGGARDVDRAMGSLLRRPAMPGFGNLGLATPGAGAVGGNSFVFNGPVGGDYGQFAREISAEQARELRYRRG